MFDSRPLPKDCASCKTCASAEWSVLGESGVAYLTRARHSSIYREGETIFHQNDEPQGIYCIETGSILLHQYDAFGNETGFRVILAGETLGWRSFFAGQRHITTAVALTPSRVCIIGAPDFRAMIHNYPSLAVAFLKSVARDRGPLDGLLLRSPHLPVRVRVINLVLILAGQLVQVGDAEGRVEFHLPLQRQQIAAMVGIRSETLSRALHDLNDEGLFYIRGRKVIIPDYGRLVRVVHFDPPV